jgi:uncharacterized protein involved in cysteine biosynthesis
VLVEMLVKVSVEKLVVELASDSVQTLVPELATGWAAWLGYELA